jgi:hypothetical protein
MHGQLRWFATTQTKGLYVVEYRGAGDPFDVWIKWRRGFWELYLHGTVSRFSVTYVTPQGPAFVGDSVTIPQDDLDALARGVREGWHAPPPQDFFDVRRPSI